VGATAAFPVILRAQATTSLTQQKEFHMEIKKKWLTTLPSKDRPSILPARRALTPLFQANDPARSLTHPLGQTLIVTAACGLAQCWGGPIHQIRPGDVIGLSNPAIAIGGL
jgi:hypothetical protein